MLPNPTEVRVVNVKYRDVMYRDWNKRKTCFFLFYLAGPLTSPKHEYDGKYHLVVCVRGHVAEAHRHEASEAEVERGAVTTLQNYNVREVWEIGPRQQRRWRRRRRRRWGGSYNLFSKLSHCHCWLTMIELYDGHSVNFLVIVNDN